LSQQNPPQGVFNLRQRRSGGDRPLGQFAGLCQIALLLIKPCQIVEHERIPWALGNEPRVFSNGGIVFLFFEIELRQSRADWSLFRTGAQPVIQQCLCPSPL